LQTIPCCVQPRTTLLQMQGNFPPKKKKKTKSAVFVFPTTNLCLKKKQKNKKKTLGLDDSCRYLPRKRRTDFKKRKQEIEKKKKTSAPESQQPMLPAMGEENEGLLNATLTQLFGEEYPFPLLDSNQSQPAMDNWIGRVFSSKQTNKPTNHPILKDQVWMPKKKKKRKIRTNRTGFPSYQRSTSPHLPLFPSFC